MSLLLDVTVPLQEGIVVWPGDESFQHTVKHSTGQGDFCNLAAYRFSSHTGTHLDPPFHFIHEGRKLDQIRPEELVGPCWVADLSHLDRHITAEDLEAAHIPPFVRRLLLKTRNSAQWADPTAPFNAHFLALKVDAVRWAMDRGVRLIGIDYASLEPIDSTEGHELFLGADGLILENLDLREATQGAYEMLCLPLLVAKGDGAPARVMLRR
ncbi:MAG TPA: cyclase family protein [Armatimonadota bacterium]|jgi:arylformamidase